MPNSDTWPRAVAVETLSNMDSAHSCDSVISVVSACSEDSMEHLSAEEKACLMYLEETLESLDLQEDSGFSNDEPDPANLKRKPVSDSLPEPDICSNIASVLAESTSSPDKPEPDITQSSNSSDVLAHIPPELTPAVLQSSSGSTTPVPALQDSDVQNSFIPPPSDFMDEPVSPASPLSDSASSPSPKSTINLDVLRRRVSEKSNPKTSPLTTALAKLTTSPTESLPEKSVSTSPAPVDPVPISQSTIPNLATPESPAIAVEPVSTPAIVPTEVPVEPKSPPPAVAPKPKKLPSNIILKSLKSPSHEGSAGHHFPMATERPLDPQKVRMEALRKLGLLKSQEVDPGPKVVHTRRSWAPASSPLSPAPKSPPASAPFNRKVQSEVPERTLPTHVQPEPLPDIIPVPAAFSDAVDDVFSDPGSPVLDKFASSAGAGGKSATLERSGLGLALERTKQTMGELRNARPRPASLGSGKDFSGTAVSAPSTAGTSESSQKLPRSQGISVLICPRAQNEEARRDALRKLGLIRD